MKRILSIDWDFFIDATSHQRAILFPDGGNENLHKDLRKYIWDSRYADPKLSTIGVSSEYESLLKIAEEFKGLCYIADSHRFAYDFVMENTEDNEEFEVYNIDYHHDLYNYRTGKERVNCGNWGTILREDNPNMKYVWVKKEDSDIFTIGNFEVDAETISFEEFLSRFDNDIAGNFDYLYLCRSAMWSPPHLDNEFIKVVDILLNKCQATYEAGINVPRPYEASGFPFENLE